MDHPPTPDDGLSANLTPVSTPAAPASTTTTDLDAGFGGKCTPAAPAEPDWSALEDAYGLPPGTFKRWSDQFPAAATNSTAPCPVTS